MGSVIFSLELTAEGKIFYESDNTVIYPPVHITNFAFTTTCDSWSEILIINIFVGETTVLWNTTETGTNEWITYLLSYNEAQEHDVSSPLQITKAIMHNFHVI